MTSDDRDGEAAGGAEYKPDPAILRLVRAAARQLAREDHARDLEAERPESTERALISALAPRPAHGVRPAAQPAAGARSSTSGASGVAPGRD